MPFVRWWESEEARIAWIGKRYKVFHVSAADADADDGDKKRKKKRRHDAFSLVPTFDEDGTPTEAYQNKMICWITSAGRSDEFQRLWEHCRASEVYEMYALQASHNYRSPA